MESYKVTGDYAKTAGAARRHLRGDSGKQAGDPERAVKAIVEALECGHAPHHLLLGNTAYEGTVAKMTALGGDFAAWQAVSRGADAPAAR